MARVCRRSFSEEFPLLSSKSIRSCLAWGGLIGLAAGLRLWGVFAAPPVWHPDEFRLVFFPLSFFSGDLNPHFFNYPSLLFYLLGIVYSGYFLLRAVAGGGGMLEFVAYRYFWDPGDLLLLARLVDVGFALGSVAWGFFLARRLGGERAGWIAGGLLAVSSLHVRQSPLAAVDVPMTFWFIGALWASVRLFQRGALRDYLTAGILVGLAAGTKYPGALAGGGVIAAHLLARRSFVDRRFWASGLVSFAVFVATTPYALLDYSSFWKAFSYEAWHLRQGRADLGRGWWYYLEVCLRYNLGWIGLLLTGAALVKSVLRPRREVWILWIVFFLYLAAMGSGKLVFARYALPLAALQCVVVSELIARMKGWRMGAVLFAVGLEALYGSFRISQLQGREDTRVQARRWLERQVPAGTCIGNFGGWAGDLQVREIGDLWWRAARFEERFGRAKLDSALSLVERCELDGPLYQYAVLNWNRKFERGDAKLVQKRRCEYVVLHRHPLPSSRVDSSFAVWLAEEGRLAARWRPEGLEGANPRYDTNDAYYVPLGDAGSLRQPGPEVEIWHLPRYGRDRTKEWTANELFEVFHMVLAASREEGTDEEMAEAMEVEAGEVKGATVSSPALSPERIAELEAGGK